MDMAVTHKLNRLSSIILLLALSPLGHAATATATVSANIVSAVSASMVGTIQLDQVAASPQSISLQTASVTEGASLNLKNSGDYAYDLAISKATLAVSEGHTVELVNFSSSVDRWLSESGNQQVRLQGELDPSLQLEPGQYQGQVSVIASFN